LTVKGVDYSKGVSDECKCRFIDLFPYLLWLVRNASDEKASAITGGRTHTLAFTAFIAGVFGLRRTEAKYSSNRMQGKDCPQLQKDGSQARASTTTDPELAGSPHLI